jgi:hypothetical protein
MKTFQEYITEKGRCWTGYKPTPGKKPFSPGSCEKVKEDTELDENHVAIAMGKEMDDEGSMIMNQLDQMERSINMMRDVVKDPKMQVPAWVQSKVTLAADYIETASGYMSSKNEEVMSAAPMNAVGGGNIAGSGGAGGEPGVSKKRNPVMSFIKRK